MAQRTATHEEKTILIRTASVALEGDRVIPQNATGIVLFAHGSGSSRFSSRNRFVAASLNDSGLATLLIDLLTSDEERTDERTMHLRFDIDLLAERLVGTIDWLVAQRETSGLRIGLFGASTGGGAALVAASMRPDLVSAVVSRGGRPDLAGAALARVQAPTLLVVGGSDGPVIAMNAAAYDQMTCERKLEIVPGATHLFEEPGKLEEVARLATEWFARHL